MCLRFLHAYAVQMYELTILQTVFAVLVCFTLVCTTLRPTEKGTTIYSISCVPLHIYQSSKPSS